MIRSGVTGTGRTPPCATPNNTMEDVGPSAWSWSSSSLSAPSPLSVHSMLVLGQVFFGLGGVIMALGLPACNPFAFSLYREVAAGALLLLAAAAAASAAHPTDDDEDDEDDDAWSAGKDHPRQPTLPAPPPPPASSSPSRTTTRTTPPRRRRRRRRWHNSRLVSSLLAPVVADPGRCCLVGMLIYGNQAAYIAGIKLAGPVAAAVWQPSQPVMTAALSMAAGWEPLRAGRIVGVVSAFAGCATMVVLSTAATTTRRVAEVAGPGPDSDGSTAAGTADSADAGSKLHVLVGNLMFFLNCSCTTFYVLLSKKLLLVHPPLLVTAWAYNVAALFMGMTAFLVSLSPDAMAFLCPDCTSTWVIPSGAWFALAYAVVFNSVAAYAILTWANKHATGTLVMIYTVLQQVTAALLTGILVQLLRVYPDCRDVVVVTSDPKDDSSAGGGGACLDPPGWGTLVGMCGVFMGLYFVIGTEPGLTTSASGQSRYEQIHDSPTSGDDDDDDDASNPRHQGLEMS